MIPIRGRTASRALVVVALALAVGGCGLSEELDRERDPDRAGPTAAASSAGTEAPGGPGPSMPSEASEAELGEDPTGDTSPGTTAGCPSSGVRMLPDLVEAAMGLRAMGVTLTNCGEKTYTLKGYPSIQLLDAEGEPTTTYVSSRGPRTSPQPCPTSVRTKSP